MIVFILLLVWAVGFFVAGMGYFARQGIGPYDQYCLPLVSAALWPVGLPVYHIVTRLRTKGRTQEDYWKDHHNPWLD